MPLQWRANVCNILDAVQIQPTTAAKPPETAKVITEKQLSYLILKLFFVQLIPRSRCLYSKSTKPWHRLLTELHAGLPSGCGLEGAESFHWMENFCLCYNCSYSNSTRSRINSTFQFPFFIILHRISLRMLILYQHLIRLFVVLWKLIRMYIRQL